MLWNNDFHNDKYSDFPVANRGMRRNTDKIGIFKEESHNILEPIKEDLDYSIGDKMPSGSVGAWYNAFNNSTGRIMVVKVFQDFKKDEIWQKFEDLEINVDILREIQWQNIINYVAVVQKDETIDVLMEYVPGGSLKFILNNFVKFKEKLVRSYTKQILEGLVSSHEKGIWHGDLKSANVLIDDLGIVKLSDYSFLKRPFINPPQAAKYRKIMAFEEETKGEEDFDIPLPGSEWYTPPEVVRDPSSKINSAYDIWQLGWIIVEMLTGKEPWYEFEDKEAVLKNLMVTETSPTINSTISDDWKSFLNYCFKIDPNKRATAQKLLKHPFLNMSVRELKESLEASNFISFFSILASQKSLSDQSNFKI